MSNEVTIWNKVMGAALSMPGVKVDRDDFLKKELKKLLFTRTTKSSNIKQTYKWGIQRDNRQNCQRMYK